jgi:Flp pilus assembly protein TadG
MISACHFGIVRRLRRFHDDQGGVSAVEFAMLLPLMITLYLGSIEITQAVSADRKMTLVAGTVGDLVAQASCMKESDVNAIFDAGKAVLYPFDAGVMKAVVTSVTIDDKQTAKVVWSKPLNGATAHAVGSNVTALIPPALLTSTGSVIWAEAYYTYTPTIGKVIAPTGIPLSEKVFLKPRLVNTPAGIPFQSNC